MTACALLLVSLLIIIANYLTITDGLISFGGIFWGRLRAGGGGWN